MHPNPPWASADRSRRKTAHNTSKTKQESTKALSSSAQIGALKDEREVEGKKVGGSTRDKSPKQFGVSRCPEPIDIK